MPHTTKTGLKKRYMSYSDVKLISVNKQYELNGMFY